MSRIKCYCHEDIQQIGFKMGYSFFTVYLSNRTKHLCLLLVFKREHDDNGREKSCCHCLFFVYENEQHTERMWLFSLQHNMHFVLRFFFLF